MKVVVLSPWKVIITGALAALLVVTAGFASAAMLGAFRSEKAQAYGADGVGARRWYFAEGYTGPGFEEWILIFNPPAEVGGAGKDVTVTLEFYGPGGFIGFERIGVWCGERKSLNINQLLKDRYNYAGDVSIVVSNYDSDAPIICERAMYFTYRGQITGGSQTFGYQEGAEE